MDVTSIADQLYFVTVYINAADDNGNTWTGTGFIITVDTRQGVANAVITNKHVVDGATSINFRMHKKDNEGKPILTQTVNIAPAVSDVIGHSDKDVDIALLPLGPILNDLHDKGEKVFFKSIDASVFIDHLYEGTLDSIEEIIFVGYPGGVYDSVHNLPIIRSGHTATPIMIDHNGTPRFIIDASVFPGSSGSPVFILNQGNHSTKNGDFVQGDRFKFIGVLAAVHLHESTGRIEVLPSSNIVSTFNQVMDLGIVFKAKLVLECIDEWLAANGHKRIEN